MHQGLKEIVVFYLKDFTLSVKLNHDEIAAKIFHEKKIKNDHNYLHDIQEETIKRCDFKLLGKLYRYFSPDQNTISICIKHRSIIGLEYLLQSLFSKPMRRKINKKRAVFELIATNDFELITKFLDTRAIQEAMFPKIIKSFRIEGSVQLNNIIKFVFPNPIEMGAVEFSELVKNVDTDILLNIHIKKLDFSQGVQSAWYYTASKNREGVAKIIIESKKYVLIYHFLNIIPLSSYHANDIIQTGLTDKNVSFKQIRFLTDNSITLDDSYMDHVLKVGNLECIKFLNKLNSFKNPFSKIDINWYKIPIYEFLLGSNYMLPSDFILRILPLETYYNGIQNIKTESSQCDLDVLFYFTEKHLPKLNRSNEEFLDRLCLLDSAAEDLLEYFLLLGFKCSFIDLSCYQDLTLVEKKEFLRKRKILNAARLNGLTSSTSYCKHFPDLSAKVRPIFFVKNSPSI